MTVGQYEPDPFEELTWDDIENWAGSRVAGRGERYLQNVMDLAVTPAGGLIATVQGGDEYTTLVHFQQGDIVSQCTCPYGTSCKHAVAVILKYLDQAGKGRNVPMLEAGKDTRLEAFGGDEEASDYDSESGSSGADGSARLKTYLEKLSKDELLQIVLQAAEDHPSVFKNILHQEKLSKGQVEDVTADIRAEILRLSAEPAWHSHWSNEGHIPDYSRVRKGLETLLSRGHADAVIDLGKELLSAGIQQIEMSDDEGETAEEISLCLEVVFRALPYSSLSPVDQMLWAIDVELGDDYGLCNGSRSFWETDMSESNWSKVADKLRRRLKYRESSAGQDDFSREYARDRLSDWIVMALENAGRNGEVVPLLEKEAIETHSYTRLVGALLKEGRKKEAERWIAKGVRAVSGKYPGIAQALLGTLIEMREKENDWIAASSLRAAEFLRKPSLSAYDELRQSAGRAEIWPAVREASLQYLETGKSPYLHTSWPLPEPEVKLERASNQDKPPMTNTLVEIAIDEKQPDEILRWYDSQPRKRGYFTQWGAHMEDRIAHGIKESYPDRAAAIWKKLAEEQIALTKPSAYEVAAGYLKDLQRLLIGVNRSQEWTSYLSTLKQANARKSRLLKTLTRLEGQKNINGKG